MLTLQWPGAWAADLGRVDASFQARPHRMNGRVLRITPARHVVGTAGVLVPVDPPSGQWQRPGCAGIAAGVTRGDWLEAWLKATSGRKRAMKSARAKWR